MSETTTCIGCGAALDGASTCAVCGVRQPSAQLRPTAVMTAARAPAAAPVEPAPPPVAEAEAVVPSAEPDGADAGEGQAAASLSRRSGSHRSQTAVTLFDLSGAARAAIDAARQRAAPEPAPPAPADSPATTDGSLEAAVEAEAGEGAAGFPWSRVARAIPVVGGVVLLALFALDSPLLPALAGPQLLLSVYYLIGGLVLTVGSLLPMPNRMRAALATAAGAVPMFVAGPVVGGVDGWRGLAAALVVLVLPGALLLRARVTGSRLARALVGAGVVLATLVYAVPDEGVVPLSLAVGLLTSGTVPGIITGVLFVLPLLLVLATLTAFAGEGSTGFGNLWAVLVLLNAAGAIVLAGSARDEMSLVHLGVALGAAGAAAAVGVADLLDPEAHLA